MCSLHTSVEWHLCLCPRACRQGAPWDQELQSWFCWHRTHSWTKIRHAHGQSGEQQSKLLTSKCWLLSMCRSVSQPPPQGRKHDHGNQCRVWRTKCSNVFGLCQIWLCGFLESIKAIKNTSVSSQHRAKMWPLQLKGREFMKCQH